MTSTDVDLTDVNGDGYADSVSQRKGSSDIKVALNTQGRTNLLKTVTTPLGGTIGLDYHRDGNTTSHPDSQWVLDDVAVKSSRGADGIADRDSTISYGNTAQDFVNRTDLGYDSVTVSEHYTSYDHTGDVDTPTTTDKVRTTQHKYRNGSVFESGLEYETTVFDGTPSGPRHAAHPDHVGARDLDSTTAGGGYAPLDLGGASVEQLLALRATPQVSKVEQDWYSGGSLQQTMTMCTPTTASATPSSVVDRGLPATARTTRWSTSPTPTARRASADLNDVLRLRPDASSTRRRPRAPFWSATNCQTWDSQPVGITVTAPNGPVLRSRRATPPTATTTR